MQTLEIAETILEQLGGKRFVAMTGARQLVGAAFEGVGSLRFRIPGKIVVIMLTAMDDYTMTIYDAKGPRIISERVGVYCDNLVDVFTSETGLRVRL